MIARVEPLVTARALRGPFDYRLPGRLSEVGVGSLLVVPFGSRRLLGVVVDMAERSDLPPERLAEPIAALEAGVPPELVRLGQWIAREYCTAPARGLELVLPPGTRRGGGEARPLERLVARRTARGAAALDDGSRLGARQRAVLETLDGTEAPAADLPASLATVRRLAERELVELRAERVARRPGQARVGAPARPVSLNAAQAAAVRAVERGLERAPGAARELLLHGVTGSGKTEVYLAAAQAALSRGRGAIVLVPEIALTPQTMGRFAARFGDEAALLHSRLSEGQRRDEWMRLRRGEARIAVGPRSAVLAPVERLGLVVIDEEHDASYKQEKDPRYDARSVAGRRAAESAAVLLCGTATPRPESWHSLARLELRERVDGSALPEVEVLDTRGDGRRGPLHERSQVALAELAEAKGKAIVLLNRRGWSPYLSCRDCGCAWQCPNCEISLVTHRGTGSLRCHHCGHSEAVPEACPECGSVTLARHGAGTERLEELVAEVAAPLPVFRLDTDSAGRAGAHAEILARFDSAPAGVLLGTQMVAKGHDFPAVTLALVVDADATLRFPDFRAEERTFALISQLAGRSGRGPQPGRVLVQTMAPDAEAIRRAAAHDASGFVRGELERRRALGYPPYAELIRIELAATAEPRLDDAARRLAELLEAELAGAARMLGPAPRFRLRGRHRRQLLVKAPVAERHPALGAVRSAVETLTGLRRLSGVTLAVDVDPQ